MKDDPIVEEVRRYRQEHAARFNYDLDLIVEDLIAQQQASGRTYVTFPPRRIEPKAKAVSDLKPADEPAGADADVSTMEVSDENSRRTR